MANRHLFFFPCLFFYCPFSCAIFAKMCLFLCFNERNLPGDRQAHGTSRIGRGRWMAATSILVRKGLDGAS